MNLGFTLKTRIERFAFHQVFHLKESRNLTTVRRQYGVFCWTQAESSTGKSSEWDLRFRWIDSGYKQQMTIKYQ